jgi:hypothetical protein
MSWFIDKRHGNPLDATHVNRRKFSDQERCLPAASATFALKAGVWFRRGRLLMVSPDSRDTACPL